MCKLGGRFFTSILIGPSYPSMRSAVIVIGIEPPLETTGLAGVVLSVKCGDGGRTVRR